METSAALGFGFRCGFLGLLHLEIIRERIEREFDIDLITTAPSVVYHLHMNDGDMMELHNPADMPDIVKIDHIDEPWIKAPRFWCPTNIWARFETVRRPPRHPDQSVLCRQPRHGGI